VPRYLSSAERVLSEATSNWTPPTLIRAPWPTSVGPSTGLPSTVVPLVDPRSSIVMPSLVQVSLAWLRETVGLAIRRSLPAAEPRVWTPLPKLRSRSMSAPMLRRRQVFPTVETPSRSPSEPGLISVTVTERAGAITCKDSIQVQVARCRHCNRTHHRRREKFLKKARVQARDGVYRNASLDLVFRRWSFAGAEPIFSTSFIEARLGV
jgi:hypothetical protein